MKAVFIPRLRLGSEAAAEFKQDRGKDYEEESNYNRLCAGGASGVRPNKHNYN
jgi:hypothetical protein